jgi:hypothetical protein
VDFDAAPLSEPAKDPATVAVPPEAGSPKPMWLAASFTMAYPENETTLAWVVLGAQVMATASGLELSRLVQPLVVLWMVVVAVPLCTTDTLDPVVVHPDALSAIDVVSGLVPELVSGGLKVTVPVTLVHVIEPVATVPPASVVGVAAWPANVVVVVGEVVVAASELEVLALEEQAERMVTSARGRASARAFQRRLGCAELVMGTKY